MEPQPVLCDTDAILNEALPNLQASSTLILDCEGINLGERGGSLSLITLRTTSPSSAQTYLIDVVRLSPSALHPIFTLLRSSSVLKIVFDGRMDFSALYHGHGVELQGVLDLQLVDVASRRESPEEHLQRLGKYLNRGEINANKRMYVDVHKLSGLAECVREHSAADSQAASKGQGECIRINSAGLSGLNIYPSVSHAHWGLRPLPKDYIAYANADATLIHTLFKKFTEMGYITPNLTSLSYTYVSMWKDNQPAFPRTGHPLLPLGIINHASSYGSSKPCTVCSRSLPEAAFSKTSWKANNRKCWVCRAVSVRGSNRRRWDSDDDDYGYEDDSDDYGLGYDSDRYGLGYDSDDYGWEGYSD